MPHFPPNNFTGPNFSVSNDRILDHLRVRQANTFKAPPATKILINPNHEDVNGLADWGDNSPVTNETLRSGVAQAGALVYSTTPILASAPPDPCFDGRNHLYFSDGDQWIPLANCLPLPSDEAVLKYGEMSFTDNEEGTDPGENPGWWTVHLLTSTYGGEADLKFGLTSRTNGVDDFEYIYEVDAQASFIDNYIEYKGTSPIEVRVSVSASWYAGDEDTAIGVFKESLGINTLQDELYQNMQYLGASPGCRNVSINGYINLTSGDKIRIKVNVSQPLYIKNMNINIQKV